MKNDRLPRLTEPKPRRRRGGKIIFLLLLFFVALLAVLFFRSDLSKIDRIDIVGNRYTTLDQIGQALDIKAGDPYFAATAAKLTKRLEKLPYVDKAVVKKTFPGAIRVEVTEFVEVAYSLGSDGLMKAMLANGQIVEPLPGETVRYLPILSGWENKEKELKALSGILAEIPAPLLADISQIKPDPTNSYPDRIRMYTRSYFEVITTIEYLPDKLDYMRAIIGEYEPGIITMLEANTHQTYESVEQESAENGEGTDASEEAADETAEQGNAPKENT